MQKQITAKVAFVFLMVFCATNASAEEHWIKGAIDLFSKWQANNCHERELEKVRTDCERRLQKVVELQSVAVKKGSPAETQNEIDRLSEFDTSIKQLATKVPIQSMCLKVLTPVRTCVAELHFELIALRALQRKASPK